jgi:methionine sulfoxide reductase heme-binding subunit
MTPLGAVGPSAYWYLARGTGAVALVLLTASVVLGVLGSIRFSVAPRWPRFAIDTLHRDVSLLVLVLLVAHIITSVLDSFAPIRLTDSIIPFAGVYRPLWMGLGALSFDLLVALVATSPLRRRLGYKTWRAVHWLAYASWPVAVLHGLGTGTDVKVWWMLGLTVACAAAVVIAVVIRIGQGSPSLERVRVPAVAAALVAPLAIAVFALQGPLQRGWARRAGTPASLLAKSSFTPASARAPAAAARTAPAPPARRGPFSAALAGTITQTAEPGGAIVDLVLSLTGGAHGKLRVRIAGAPIDGGGLSMTGSQVVLAATGLPSVMQGHILSLQGQQFLARVAGASGSAFDLRANLTISGQGSAVTGTLSATPAGGGG